MKVQQTIMAPGIIVDHEYSYTSLTTEKVASTVVYKLNAPESYFVWRSLFEAILKRYKLTGIVDGSQPCPDNEADPGFDVWHDKDQKLIMWIKSTLSEDVALRLVPKGDIPSNSSRDLWLGLEKRFSVPGVSPEYRRKMSAAALATADICDANAALLESGHLRLLEPVFQNFGKWARFFGRVMTVKCFENNTLVMEAVSRRGEGRVLVVDGGGSMRRALAGGVLTKTAEVMGWAGIVVNGCVRDVDEINECEIGVRALATSPVKPLKGKDGIRGHTNIDVNIGGTWIADGEWLYADTDGILVSTTRMSV